jgi:hypothetical protein
MEIDEACTSTAAGSTVVNRPENTSLSAFFSANDEPSWITMSSNRATAAWPSGREDPDAQLLDQPREHLMHELGEPRSSEPVVERLVRDGDIVLMVELAEQIGEGLDLPRSQCRHHRQEQTMRRDSPQPLALAGIPAELVDIIDGQRACKRDPHPGKVRGRQRGLPSVGVETAWSPSLSLSIPGDLPPPSREIGWSAYLVRR